jgi:hypothetical protein
MRKAMRLCAVLAAAVAFAMVASAQSMATPAIAQKEKAPCTKCHTAPPALNDYGKSYKK